MKDDAAIAREILDKFACYIEPKEYYATIEEAIASALRQKEIEVAKRYEEAMDTEDAVIDGLVERIEALEAAADWLKKCRQFPHAWSTGGYEAEVAALKEAKS